jgi:outer membrane protein assembly factor BamE
LPVGLVSGLVGGCVYRLDVQQGNLLDQKDIEAVQEGMTRSQVRYLLGTPIAVDPFRADRWDYMYYLKPGKSTKATQRWVIVRFDGDVVREIDMDVPIGDKG